MTRVVQGAACLLVCAVAFAGLLGGAARAQTFNPQPYLVFEVPPEPVPLPALVDLDDQFILEQDVPVIERYRFMNPVEKIPLSPPGQEEPITDPLLHYRWYRIDLPAQGTYSVQVTNQFGDHAPWTIVDKPEYLLAPASKLFYPEDPGPPPPGQHYDCYPVVDAPPVAAVVDLNDQFGNHGPKDVLQARYLCVPVQKTREDGTVYPIFQATNARDHLACYDIPPHPHAEVVNIRTQFTGIEPELLQIVEDRMLCVPSEKTRLEVEPQPYLVYEVPPEPVPQPTVVDLDDQFITEADVPVTDRHFLMNPVTKTPLEPPNQDEPITDPNLHYRWYAIQVDRPGSRNVKVTNQFGVQVPWEISAAPVYLLAPASKVLDQGEPGPEPPGNHYDCYDVLDAPPAGALVSLTDQFGVHPDSDVGLARFLCAPTVKTNQGVVYPVEPTTDGRDHLACYEVPPHPHTEIVNTRTQFTGVDPDVTPVIHDFFLCVPSVKIYREVPSLAPWGIATLGLVMVLTVLWTLQRGASRAKRT